jgi:hypothetical protein
MYARTLELALLATLALFCAAVAYALDNLIFGAVFAVFSAVAVLSAALTWTRTGILPPPSGDRR